MVSMVAQDIVVSDSLIIQNVGARGGFGLSNDWKLVFELKLCCTVCVHKEGVMTKNITLRMDEEILRKAKHIAVEHDMSLSAWLTQVVEKETRQNTGYEETKAKALKVLESPGHHGGRKFTREEMHERRHISGQ